MPQPRTTGQVSGLSNHHRPHEANQTRSEQPSPGMVTRWWHEGSGHKPTATPKRFGTRVHLGHLRWWRGRDSNPRPSGYEELDKCPGAVAQGRSVTAVGAVDPATVSPSVKGRRVRARWCHCRCQRSRAICGLRRCLEAYVAGRLEGRCAGRDEAVCAERRGDLVDFPDEFFCVERHVDAATAARSVGAIRTPAPVCHTDRRRSQSPA